MSLSTAPPAIVSVTFDYTARSKGILYVPEGCKTIYEQTDGWMAFGNIQEGVPTAIETVPTSQQKQTDAIYSLSGQKVTAPQKGGIYVVDGKKVVMK